MSDKIYNVLFVCTGNSARSIMAEALMNHIGRGRFRAFSAGSHPTGQVNPYTLLALEKLALPMEGLRSKSWDEFAKPDSVPLDFVLTVCDKAAGEVCPVWPGQPMSAHWGVADPAAVDAEADRKLQAFIDTAMILKRRIELLLALPIASIDSMSLQKTANEIGKS